MVGLAGFEPATNRLEGDYSIRWAIDPYKYYLLRRPNMKTCPNCKTEKETTEFYNRRNKEGIYIRR